MHYATDIELHVHTYAVGVADIAAREGSPHNVLHSSSLLSGVLNPDTVIDRPGRVFPTTAVRFPESGRLVYSLLCMQGQCMMSTLRSA